MNTTNIKAQTSNFWANLFKTPTERSDLEDVLRSMPIFRNVDQKRMNILMELMHNRAYQANEYIFHQGDPGIGLYIIKEGKVLISQSFEDKGSQDLTTFERGDFFGELALIDDHTRSASAIAITDCTIYVIFKPDLDDFIETYPQVGIKILWGIAEIITTRLRAINKDYLELLFEQQGSLK